MSDSPGLYVHVPFCARRCPYCDFYSISALELVPKYIENLKKEADMAVSDWGVFSTLYLGGGSPSLLNKEGLTSLFKAIKNLDVAKNAEITLEANPEDVTEEQASLWAEAGINRISLGVQSFDDRWLGDCLARTHLASQNIRAAELLKQHGFRLSLDLIYGNPSQEPEHWAADLAKAADLEPDHISTYCLTVEPHTALARSIAEKYLPPLPPSEMLADMFMISREVLSSHGFYRYEVSNFAKPGCESAHNLKYWRRQPYLGLGPSAHSFNGHRRWANVRSLRQWSSALRSGVNGYDFIEDLTDEAARLESIMLGLRLTEGLPETLLADTPKLAGFIESGHLVRTEGRLRPTELGLLIADRLALELS